MSDLKTKENDASVAAFMATIDDAQKKADCEVILQMMQEASGEPPKMWGASIVGFGHYHYKYASGREGEWFCIGFSPRKASISLYIMSGVGRYQSLLNDLGKHKTGKGCLYVKRLSDVDQNVLRKLIDANLEHFRDQK